MIHDIGNASTYDDVYEGYRKFEEAYQRHLASKLRPGNACETAGPSPRIMDYESFVEDFKRLEPEGRDFAVKKWSDGFLIWLQRTRDRAKKDLARYQTHGLPAELHQLFFLNGSV